MYRVGGHMATAQSQAVVAASGKPFLHRSKKIYVSMYLSVCVCMYIDMQLNAWLAPLFPDAVSKHKAFL